MASTKSYTLSARHSGYALPHPLSQLNIVLKKWKMSSIWCIIAKCVYMIFVPLVFLAYFLTAFA